MIEEMIAVVEAYIHHRADKQIRINTSNVNMPLLIKAYDYAVNWFNNNNGNITLIHR